MQNKSSSLNLLILTTISSVWGIAAGLIGPFLVLYVEKVSGGIEKVGLAYGIMIFLEAITNYVAGHFSDKLGRKPLLFLTLWADAIVVFLYTVVDRAYQVYILQALMGITTGVFATISTALLGDMTVKENRGASVGRFNAIVCFTAAGGVSLGGYVIKAYSYKPLFYFSSIVIALSTVLLFFIKEEDR